jgi:hypothetical protein
MRTNDMKVKPWIAASVVTAAIAAISVWAGSSQFRVFRTSAYTVIVSQTSSAGVPRYSYGADAGHDLVALALGGEPTSNQFLAIAINCDSTSASLIVYDKSNSNMTIIAQSTSLDKVLQGSLVTGNTNVERFVALCNIQPVGNLTGGYLTIAGRFDLDTSGCAQAVLVTQDRDPFDKVIGDVDVPNLDAGSKSRDREFGTERSGRAHLIGVLNVVSGGQKNAVLLPSGHLTFHQQLDEFMGE